MAPSNSTKSAIRLLAVAGKFVLINGSLNVIARGHSARPCRKSVNPITL